MSDEPKTHFIDGLGWVVACRDAARWVRQQRSEAIDALVAISEDAGLYDDDPRYTITEKGAAMLEGSRK